MLVLGIAASLRNARFGVGGEKLIEDLRSISTKEDLGVYLRQQTKVRFDEFAAAGRNEKKPFTEIYKELRKLRGERGLSNSEGALASALWGAIQEGCDAHHISLSTYFPMHGRGHNLDQLKVAIMEADALIVSGPVYFGDRGSLAQSFVDFVSADTELRESLRGKLYAGLAVGAKRNGGQETTLIYQMLDMVNLDMLAVGNSGETTSQYGGTVVAGDVGKMHEDDYGINTSIGTGRRVGRVSQILAEGRRGSRRLKDKVTIGMWLLQDSRDRRGASLFDEWAKKAEARHTGVEFKIMDATQEEVVRCIACDICPTNVGPTEEYRCVITSKEDFFVRHHKELLECDAVLICAYSPEERTTVNSCYQQFVERTRYLRRDNYCFTDKLFAPFVISELSARQNLHLRILTSSVRHHTILHHPLIGILHEDEILRPDTLAANLDSFIKTSQEVTIGRYVQGHQEDLLYQPLGYEVSAAQVGEDRQSGKSGKAMQNAVAASAREAKRRLEELSHAGSGGA